MVERAKLLLVSSLIPAAVVPALQPKLMKGLQTMEAHHTIMDQIMCKQTTVEDVTNCMLVILHGGPPIRILRKLFLL